MKKIVFIILVALNLNIAKAQNPWESCPRDEIPCMISCEITDADHPYTGGEWVQECKINNKFFITYGANCEPGENKGATFICKATTNRERFAF